MTNEIKFEKLTNEANEVLQILSTWGINTAQQATLLGLPMESINHHRFNIELPKDNEMVTRVKALLAIDQSMCLVFPHTPELARLWISTPSHFFARRTPLDVMLVDGLPGILNVRMLLEGTESW